MAILPANVNPGQSPNEAHPAAADFDQIGTIKVLGASGVWLSVGVGTDGQVLTADSTKPSGVKWA